MKPAWLLVAVAALVVVAVIGWRATAHHARQDCPRDGFGNCTYRINPK